MLFNQTKKLAKALKMSAHSSRNTILGPYNTYHMTIQIIHNGSAPCYCVRIPVTFDDAIICSFAVSIVVIQNIVLFLYL